MTGIPALFARLCDDAAIFPPGLAPLPAALDAHRRHRGGWYSGLVGPFVVSEAVLDEAIRLADLAGGPPMSIVVTLPGPSGVPAVAKACARSDAVELVGLEVALGDAGAGDVRGALDDSFAGGAPRCHVEVPRDERRSSVLDELVAVSLRAKFRVGGVEASLYPDETEFAEAITESVRRCLPFKATAGLHHAVRNTDPVTGFEQHGFVNVLAAVDAALAGSTTGVVAEILGDRDGASLARMVDLPVERAHAVRRAFDSFGTCSIGEPLGELKDLGLIRMTSGDRKAMA